MRDLFASINVAIISSSCLNHSWERAYLAVGRIPGLGSNIHRINCLQLGLLLVS
jgi:hypothetical protein